MPIDVPIETDEDENDPTAPYNELEVFHSMRDALRWKHIRKRIPVCFKKTLRNRYMLANLIYLGYTIGLLIIDFHPDFATTPQSGTTERGEEETTTTIPPLDQPVLINVYVNNIYIGLAVVNIVVAFLYILAWRGRSWLDVILIPEYLNHIQAGLYLWSAVWYSRQDTLGGYYTMAVHRIELAASCVEVCAAIGWMISWHMTYTRTLGRGFTFDDPDTMAYLTTTTNTFIYLVYNIEMNIYPEQYGTNLIFSYADILGFIGSVYYIFGTLRDENWFWFLPLAGQYGIAAGRIHIDTRTLPKFGIPPMLITNICKRKKSTPSTADKPVTIDIETSYF